MKKCQRCSNIFSNGSSFCNYCGLPVHVSLDNLFPSPNFFLQRLESEKWPTRDETQALAIMERRSRTDTVEIAAEEIEEYHKEDSDFFAKAEAEIATVTQEDGSGEEDTLYLPLPEDGKKSHSHKLKKSAGPEAAEVDEVDIDSAELDIAEEESSEQFVIAKDIDSDELASTSSRADIEVEEISEEVEVEEISEEVEVEELEDSQEVTASSQKLSQVDGEAIVSEAPLPEDSNPNIEIAIEETRRIPEEWEWMIFPDDSELERQGYKVAGISNDFENYDFLLFSDDKVSCRTILAQITPEETAEWRELLAKKDILPAVRVVRRRFNLRFSQATEVLRLFARQEKIHFPRKVRMLIDHLSPKERKQILRILRNGKTIDAISLFRQLSRLSLKECREQIEYLCERQNIPYDPTQIHTGRIKQNRRKKLVPRLFLWLVLLAGIAWLLHYVGILGN